MDTFNLSWFMTSLLQLDKKWATWDGMDHTASEIKLFARYINSEEKLHFLYRHFRDFNGT